MNLIKNFIENLLAQPLYTRKGNPVSLFHGIDDDLLFIVNSKEIILYIPKVEDMKINLISDTTFSVSYSGKEKSEFPQPESLYLTLGQEEQEISTNESTSAKENPSKTPQYSEKETLPPTEKKEVKNEKKQHYEEVKEQPFIITETKAEDHQSIPAVIVPDPVRTNPESHQQSPQASFTGLYEPPVTQIQDEEEYSHIEKCKNCNLNKCANYDAVQGRVDIKERLMCISPDTSKLEIIELENYCKTKIQKYGC